MKWKLKSKMFLFILSTTLLIYIAALGSISITFRKRALKDIIKIADLHAKESAFLVQSRLNEYFGAARTLSHAFEKMDSLIENQRESITEMILRNVLVRNPEYIAAFLQWELQYIDPDYHKPYGRKRKSLYRDAGQIVEKDEILDIEGDDTSGIYYKVKSSGKEYLTRPYYYTYQHEQALPSDEPLGEEAILEATIIIPIIINDRFIGLTGVDIPLTKFQKIIDELESFKNSYTFLIANNGHFVAHPDSKFINRLISDFCPDCTRKHQITEMIHRGESFSFISKKFLYNEEAYVSFVPFQTGRTDTPWSIGIVVPLEEILKEANTPFYLSVSAGILGFFALVFVIWIISSNITKPLKSTTDLFKKLAGGQISDAKRLIVSTNDEIGDMTHSANILLDGLNRTVAFAKKIGNSDLDADYQLLSPDDTLGKSLVEMRNQLKESKKAVQSQSELLIEKNKDLEKLNAAKDKFFSIIAHDLKNPFSVLLSVTTSLSEGFDDLSETDKNMSINRINKSVTLLYNLLENLLQWSLSQTGRLKYSPEKNDLYLLVFHNISLLKMNAEKRNIKIKNNLKEGISVFVDTDMINTVIRNLVSNAIKFNVDGGTIEINALQKDNMIEIEIKDTGIGLTDEDIEKLFRIDVKNTSIGSGNKEKGTGIGLIICKEFVEKNGGHLRVSSENGKGSKFCFTVPIFKS